MPATPLQSDTPATGYAPQYLDGFPVQPAGDSALASAVSTLPVMEVPSDMPVQRFVDSPLRDTPSMTLLLVVLLALALSYHRGYRYIENFFHYMFSTRRRENLFEDHTVNETGIQIALIANTCVVEGFLIYCAVRQWWPSFAPLLQRDVFGHIAAYSGIAAAFYVAQWFVYKVIGFTFSDAVGSKLWLDGFKASQAMLGLVLLPVMVLALLYPDAGKLLLAVAAMLYLAARVIFINKGFRIFYSNLSSILYFILYLCAVEMVPLAIMTSVTHWISGI